MERHPAVQGRAVMNLRVFLLVGAMAAFGALWSSDGRYQAEQETLARMERVRSIPVAVTTSVGRMHQRAPTQVVTPTPVFLTSSARAATKIWALRSDGKVFAARKTVPTRDPTVNPRDPKALFARLFVAWSLGFDPGSSVRVFADQANAAKARVEERMCLVRFRARQSAYFASRRFTAFLRAQIAGSREQRAARVVIRQRPIKQTQAPAAGGRETR
jgi:hypothetical protein